MKYISLLYTLTLISAQSAIKSAAISQTSAYSEEYKQAALDSNKDKIKELNISGYDINAINPLTGDTHLVSAAISKNKHLATALLLSHADPKHSNINGTRAIDWVYAKDDGAMIELLSEFITGCSNH